MAHTVLAKIVRARAATTAAWQAGYSLVTGKMPQMAVPALIRMHFCAVLPVNNYSGSLRLLFGVKYQLILTRQNRFFFVIHLSYPTAEMSTTHAS